MQFHEYKHYIFGLNFIELCSSKFSWQNVRLGKALGLNMVSNDIEDDESALVEMMVVPNRQQDLVRCSIYTLSVAPTNMIQF